MTFFENGSIMELGEEYDFWMVMKIGIEFDP